MKETLLRLRQTLKNTYKKFDMYLLPGMKFLLAFVLFYFLTVNFGYLEALNSMFIVVILALFCAILPLNWMVVIGIALIVLHSFGIAAEIGFFALCLYVVLAVLFLRYAPKTSLAVLLTPAAFAFNMPAAVPVCLGMTSGAASAISALCSVISYYYICNMPAIYEMKTAGDYSSLELLKEAMNLMTKDNEMLLGIIAFVAVTLIVYMIRKLVDEYGWLTSVIVGCGLYIFLTAVGAAVLQMSIDVLMLVLGSLLSAVISLVVVFFLFSVNYRGSRYIQFEDDDYYYYVKAIPKDKPASHIDEDGDQEEFADVIIEEGGE